MKNLTQRHGDTEAWPRVRLGDVCEFVFGFAFDSGLFNTEGNGVPLVRIRDVVPGFSKTYTTQPFESCYAVKDGDLLVGMDGDFNVAKWCGGDATLNQRVCKFVPNENKLLPGYLQYSLAIELKEIWDNKSFSTVKHLLAKDLNAITLSLPPLSVQQEIVARLEKELATVDRMVKGFEAMKAETDQLFKAELKEAFEDIKRRGAETQRLGEIGRVAMCKRVLKHQTSFDGGIPFYKIGTFGKTPNAYISKELFEELAQKYSYPRKGDVLISAAGTIGRTVVFDGSPSYFQDSNIVWLEHDGSRITNEYLKVFYWNSPWKVSDGATIPRLYNGDVEGLEIPVPPLTAQREIVAKLDAVREKCAKLKSAAEEGLKTAALLRKAILKEAFE